MSALKEITRSKDPINLRASRILESEDWIHSQQWHDQNDETGTEEAVRWIVEPSSSGENGVEGEIYFFLTGVPGLENWVFHQYDDDFFPSIPHGHLKGKMKRKLDSYLGWVYEGSRQIDRERRSVIVNLWNDETFRRFASIAIDYFLKNHPYYGGWRVADPRVLPKKRRGIKST